jgi:hypothetical protein
MQNFSITVTKRVPNHLNFIKILKKILFPATIIKPQISKWKNFDRIFLLSLEFWLVFYWIILSIYLCIYKAWTRKKSRTIDPMVSSSTVIILFQMMRRENSTSVPV